MHSLAVLLTEHVNLKLFKDSILQTFAAPTPTAEVQPLTADEANALRYSAGYVPFALQKKLKKRPEFKKWLQSFAVEGEESSYLDYTKKWTSAVNRGGLFRVNDNTYEFFVDLEMRVRNHLPKMLRPNSELVKKEVIEDITSSDEVIFSWMTVISDFDDAILSGELLHYVVELWLTI